MHESRDPTSYLIVSDETAPAVRLRDGMKFEVHSVTLVDPEMTPVPDKIGARLCGGTSTCLALVDPTL
jgi:hypothetical protein